MKKKEKIILRIKKKNLLKIIFWTIFILISIPILINVYYNQQYKNKMEYIDLLHNYTNDEFDDIYKGLDEGFLTREVLEISLDYIEESILKIETTIYEIRAMDDRIFWKLGEFREDRLETEENLFLKSDKLMLESLKEKYGIY